MPRSAVPISTRLLDPTKRGSAFGRPECSHGRIHQRRAGVTAQSLENTKLNKLRKNVNVAPRTALNVVIKALYFCSARQSDTPASWRARMRERFLVSTASIVSGLIVTTVVAQWASTSGAQTTPRYLPEYTASGD